MFSYSYLVDTIHSTVLNDTRELKVYLPKNYSALKKYPTIYTLDGKTLFQITLEQVYHLSSVEEIPECIVVGIFHKNRSNDIGINRNGGFTPTTLLFKSFLVNELVPYINSNYTTSGYNVIVGHSNSASFVQNLLVTDTSNLFKGFIALSQGLFGNDVENYIAFLQNNSNKETYYFIASGNDNRQRFNDGMKIDSISKKCTNPLFSFLHFICNAGHQGIAVEGINPGLNFVFKDCSHLKLTDKIMDSIIANKVSPMQYFKQHIAKINKSFGIDFKPNTKDMDVLFGLVSTDADAEEYKKYDISEFGKDSIEFYNTYAQLYEKVGSFKKALYYWKLNIETPFYGKLFYSYHRPIDLLNNKMNLPKDAILIAELGIAKLPNEALFFNYIIAKIAGEKNVETKKGLKAINYCIDNYKKNNTFSMENVILLKTKLVK